MAATITVRTNPNNVRSTAAGMTSNSDTYKSEDVKAIDVRDGALIIEFADGGSVAYGPSHWLRATTTAS